MALRNPKPPRTQQRMPRLSRYDLSLKDSINARLLATLTALMVFLGVMCLAVFLIVNGISRDWATGLSHRMTVEIVPAIDEDPVSVQRKADSVLGQLKSISTVRTAEAVPQREIVDSLRPWFGGSLDTLGIPMPVLIEVTLDPELTEPKTAKGQIKFALQDKTPYARIDDHAGWSDDVVALARVVKLTATGLLAFVMGAVVIAIIGVTSGRVAIHRSEIDILSTIGARDEYIIRQFEHYTLASTIKGAILGTIGAIAALAAMRLLIGDRSYVIAPGYSFDTLDWILLLLAPVIAVTVISLGTARLTLARALRVPNLP